MNYVELTVGNESYKLRLSTRNIVALEKQIGCNPIMIFGNGNRIPTLTEMVQIFHASAQQYNHGITLDKAFDIFDKYLEEHTPTDFIPVIVDIYKQSGILSKGEETEKN